MADTNGALCQKSATYDGKEYQVIREGLAEILKPGSSTEQNSGCSSKPQTVFYNPIQQFNRDLSVLAIRAFAEDLALIRRRRKERASGKAKHRGNKRKRPDEEQHAEHATPSGKSHKASSDGEQRMNGMPEELDANSKVVKDWAPIGPRAAAPKTPSFRILDALSATGLRALRYAKEIPGATHITANDLSPAATSSIKLNVEHNNVTDIIHPTTGDARALMYQTASSSRNGHGEQLFYQVIDLDPYGTAAPFLDAAVQALADGGLLCVTCTDAGVFASVGYLEKTFSQYGGLPFKGPQSHEGGLRLILHAIATSAARYGMAIEPLLSLSIDFYARLFVRIRRSPAEVKFLASKSMLIYNCDSGCGAWSTQFLAQTKERKAQNGDPCYAFSLAQAPSTDRYCEHCGFKTHLSGPMWGGPLHNPYFCQKILDLLPSLDAQVYGTIPRMEGMLTLAMNETSLDIPTPDLPPPDAPAEEVKDGPVAETKNFPAQEIPFPSLPPHLLAHHPFFILPSHLSRILHSTAPPEAALRGALAHLGYRTTRSHTKPGSIATNAPWAVLWEIMREWVRQKAPTKPGALKEGMPGWGIMRKDRGRDKALETAKNEVRKVLDDNKVGSVQELKTELEATLYRISVGQTEGAVADGGGTDTNALTVNFDEKLGKEQQGGKRLVRYQMNPRPDWGPMNKASG